MLRSSERAMALIVALCSASLAQPEAPPPDAKAQEVLAAMSAYHRGLGAFTVRLRYLDASKYEDHWGFKNQTTYTIAVQRPDKLAIIGADAESEISLASDGARLQINLLQAKEHASFPAPKNVSVLGLRDGDALDSILMRYIDAPGLRAILADDPLAALSDEPEKAAYLGIERIASQEAHHLRMDVEGQPGEVWIATGEQPALLRAVQTYQMRNILGSPTHQLEYSYDEATYSFWGTRDELKPARFHLDPLNKNKENERLRRALLAPPVPSAKVPQGVTAERVWTLDGAWVGVASAGGLVYAVTPHGELNTVSPDGTVLTSVDTQLPSGVLAAAVLTPDRKPALLSATWDSSTLTALTTSGEVLWTKEFDESVPCFRPADLNGDGIDEIILGGGLADGGVHVLGADAQAQWSSEGPDWVRALGVVDTDGNGTMEILASGHNYSDSDADFRLLGENGRKLVPPALHIEPGEFQTVTAGGDKPASVVAVLGWYHNSPGHLECFEPSGAVRSMLHLGRSMENLHAARTRPWVLASGGGRGFVVDVSRGVVIATIDHLPVSLDVAWLEQEGQEPLLVVVGDGHLAAYRILGR